jgi:hypothetical protein
MLAGFRRKIEGKRPLEMPRCRWEDKIEMRNRMGWYGLDSCLRLSSGRL